MMRHQGSSGLRFVTVSVLLLAVLVVLQVGHQNSEVRALRWCQVAGPEPVANAPPLSVRTDYRDDEDTAQNCHYERNIKIG